MPTRTAFDIDTTLKAINAIEYGVVHWFNNDYGVGSITPDASGPDVFVHCSEIDAENCEVLTQGQRVSYLIEGTRRQPEAKAVHVL